MAPLSLKIVQDNGAVTRKVKMDANLTVREATYIVKEKANLPADAKSYALFLRSLDNDLAGIWLEDDRTLAYYMLRDGDRLDYMSKIRNLRLRMLDDTVKTLQVDQSKLVSDLMISICSKIGITNHEEYGMCFDQEDEVDESKENKSGAGQSGTLTLKKKSQLKERDLEFEQMIKKFKTDDYVDWVDSHKTLSEACISPDQTLLLKRRLFYSDRNVDSRDPVQLNLLYVQARDNILNTRHPVTEDKAAEFAGIQCQIQFGDYHEEKHKPGFIENLSEYLPEQYCSSWGIEKKILKEYSKHVELNELEAKHLYTKTARALPTYGVTFFLVKEKQKGKKKLVPRLLGINADAILRLDETTKEILQQWPLTHVKTYYAGKGETFTLNFGDYSDKEYSVKTRDALRIRDILEGYIDLIRKRMLATYNQSQNEYGTVGQDIISSGQASMMQHISNSPMKIVEQSCVGPSKILQYEPGQKALQGTQMVTVQQILTSDLINKQGQGVKGEVPLRKDMSIPFTKRLNRMNSNSVKIVTFLTEPSQAKIEDAQKIVDEMNADMPFIRDGVKETVANQTNEDEKKKLEDQLHRLEELMKLLSESSKPDSVNTSEADDAAKQIADLTTQMYFAMDPKTRRRSRILSKSRTSFIADEKTERNLRRASFIAATATANHAIDNAEELLREEFKGPALDAKQVEELEKSAIDKLGKINAAIAHYLLAHSDPQNIDYAAAVNSLNTIHELVPELAKDGQALASVKDGKDRQELLADIKELCAAAKHVCSLSGVEDAEKLQEASAKYSDVAGRLVFTFGRRCRPRAEKENEIIELAKAAGGQTSLLLMSAQGLTEMASAEPAAQEVDTAGARTAAAAKDLLAQAKLNAPTISEPHCQSALTAASEALSSSAQQLAATWKPLVEDPARHEMGERLHNRTMDLAKALDRLRESYAHLGDVQDGSDAPKTDNEAERLKFINTVSRIGGNLQTAGDDLNKPLTSEVKEAEAKEAELRLAQRLAQLNAAIASLLSATSDREHPDYATADLALRTINELMPEVVKDSKTATANQGEPQRAALLDNIKALCAASNTICASSYGVAKPEELSDAINNYTDTSGKLTYVINKRANPDQESEIIHESTAACNQAGVLLSGVQQLSEAVKGEKGAELDAKGAALADNAKSLLTTAQVTAASIADPRCQSTLHSSIDKLSSSGKQMADSWAPLAKDPKQEMRVQALNGALKQLEAQLDKLRAASHVPEQEIQLPGSQMVEGQSTQDPQQKLLFVMSMNGAKGKLADAQKELSKPTMTAKGADVNKVQKRLSLGLGQLNAAIASLLAATADRENPDYVAAEQAANTIAELMPQVIQDTKTVSASKDEPTRAAMLAQIKELCEASEGICAGADGSNPQDLNDAVTKFTNASGKLVYVVSPRVNPARDEQIMKLSNGACGQMSQLLTDVAQLAAAVGGDKGQELDEQGGRVADAANNMLQTAQITAPSLTARDCQDALLSSVDNLSGAGQQLAASLAPLDSDPKHKKQSQALQQALKQLEADLEALREACKASEADLEDPSQKQQKLDFIKSMRGAKEKLGDAHKELNKPTKPAKGAGVEEVQQRLSDRLAQLNAAIASLLAATADREKPDYVAAEKAANTIAGLMPHVIQDTKTVSASKDEPTRAAMLAQIKELCEASEGICAGADGSNPQGLNDAVAKFTNASGKLVYVVSPRVNPVRDEKIVALSSGACGQTSQLLSGVAQLAAAVGGDKGQELDEQGGRVADAANNMLQTAQITAPSMSSKDCQDTLLSSVENLSGAGQQLAASLAPLDSDPKHNKQSQALQQALKQLEAELEALREACKASEDLQDPSQKQKKLEFIKSMRGAKEKLGNAHKELNKPTKPAKGAAMEEVQQRLSDRLAQLNAAIASLLAATADREKPDYVAAEKATNTIAELVPHVIQDTKTVSASKDEPTRAAMLAQIKELCEASEGICAGADGSNSQGLNDAVGKFTNASGKLVYVVSPRANPERDDQIIALSSGACGQASQLLSGVAQLAASVGGDKGQELDEQGGRVADAANNMLQTAQITAPSMSSKDCQDTLLSSVDNLSGAGQQLAASLAPLDSDPKHKKQSQALQQALKQLEAELEALREACKASEEGLQDPIQKQQKLEFIKSMQGAKGKLGDAHKELNKPTKPAKGSDMEKVQDCLSQRLGQLNAAIAALLAATADREKPDYVAAEKASNTIAELVPYVIQDTKTLSASKDEPTRAAMLAQIKELCEASEGICAGADGSNPQGLNDAVAKFTNASGKLVYVVSPRVNPARDEQIIALSTGAGGQTSQLLSATAQLAAAVGGEEGQLLDAQGARVADAAQAMLQTAQITAPSMSSPHCKETLLSSVDSLSGAGQQLAASLAPLNTDPKHKNQSQALQQALQQLEAQLEVLREACRASDVEESEDPSQKQQKLQFVKTMQGAKGKLGDAQKELNKPTKPAKGSDVEKVQDCLSQRLGQLNAAIAALLAATADREKPDYAAAEKAATTIADLMPQVIQDTKTVSASKDEPTRAAMLAQIKELCEASEGICAGADGSNPQALNDAVAKFTNASGKLVYVVSPRVNPVRDEKIIALSTGAGGQTSQLLSATAQLAAAVGGEEGRLLDAQGGRVADAAQAMLQTAQITAPCMSSPDCQDMLLSSVNNLSGTGQQLAASLTTLDKDPMHKKQSEALQKALQQLEAQLEALRQACKEPEAGPQKLQFIKTLQGAKGRLGDAQKELDKPTKPAKGSDVEKVQQRLSERLGQLNAAIALLLAATADRENPNYLAAEQAANTIADLVPHVIKDTKTVSASKDEPTRAAMLAQIKELCEASEGICAGADGSNPQGLNNAVAKFTDASGKLVYVVSPRKNVQREDQIVKISSGAGSQASQLLTEVAQLAAAVGGDKGQQLDAQGGRVADAAQTMIQTAQITSPSISSPHCQDLLLSSVDNLSGTGLQLAASLAPLNTDPKHKQQSQAVLKALQQLEDQLETLRKACKSPDIVDSKETSQEQKLQFIKTVQECKERWADAQRDLQKPTPPSKGQDLVKTQDRLSQRLAKLNAAIASLLSATADREQPQYVEAEKSVKTIIDLLPQVVQDTKTVSASKDEPTRAAMLAQIKELCEASEGICAGAAGTNQEVLNDAIVKYTDASGKLVYVVCPRVNPQRENQIVGLSTGAGSQTSQLLSGVAALAATVGGDKGQQLDSQGGRVADAAQAMLQAAQITAPSMSSPHCQNALLSSVEQLSSSAHQLSSSLAPLQEDPKHNLQTRKLNQALQQLQAQLEALKKACLAPDTAPPCKKPPPPPGTKLTAGWTDGSEYMIGHAGPNKRTSADITQDFLDRLRCEEGMAQTPLPLSSKTSSPAVVAKVEKVKPPPPVRKTDDDKRLQQQFVTLVNEAEKKIKEDKASLIKLSNQETGTGPALSQSEMMKKQEALQHNLALASVEVANLVAANYDDKIDYTAASKSAKTLPQLMTTIVQDGKQLSDNVNDMARKAFLYDLLQMCDSSTKICDAAKTDRLKLNEAAVEFGDRSTKLLYVVSNDVDSALEKEIISRAKAIGDSASRLAEDAVAVAASGTASSSVQDICDAGTACVDAAGKLVYTAKLTAPSIHETPCQNALVTSTETLSTKLRSFSDSWKPLSSDPHQAKTIKDLTKEAENLERILEGLRSDVKGGNIGKRREMEQLVIEDSPMRQLTVKILDDAKVYAETSDLPATQKIEYAAYADKLKNALRALDLANARCKKTPHDTNKRRELENAIQNLQMILLQSRPKRGEKGKSNIVDLRDFIEEVSSEAKNLSTVVNGVKVPTAQDTRTLEEIKEKCSSIETKAYKLMNVDSRTDLDSTFNDIMEVDQFGQECDDLIKEINADLKGMEDVKAKRVLYSQMLPLSESCNMLRFATKSGISTEASATLDSSLDDLDDIEARVITSIVPDVAEGVVLRSKQPRPAGNSTATISLCREVTSSSSGVAPPTVTAYIADAVSKTDTNKPEEKNKLLKHLYKLVHLLKTLTVTTSMRTATWQTVDGPEVATITEQILKEIHNPESKFGVKAGETKNNIINESDIAKLLIPSAPKILGDHKQQEDKLVQLAAKLNSMCGQVTLGVAAPSSLARSAHAAADAALELDAIARGCTSPNPIQSKKVDQAAKEMSFATYNVLKTAESACQDPNNPNLRRRLGDTCEMLNLSINKLVSASSSAPALQQQCGMLQRSAALQLSALQPRALTVAPFHDTCAQLTEQRENIYKLKSDQSMPRKLFMDNLEEINTAVRKSTESASQCAYFIAISETHKDIAKSGLVDVPQIQKSIEAIQDSCMVIIGSSNISQAKEEKEDLIRRVQDLSGALDKAHVTVKDSEVKRTLVRAKSCVSDAASDLEDDLKDGGDMDKITPKAVTLLEAVNRAHCMIEQCPLVPRVGDNMSAATKASCDEVINHSKNLLTNTLALLKDVNSSPEEQETMTWVTFNTSRKKLLDSYDVLVKTVQKNGHRAGIYLGKAPEEEKEEVKKSYIEIQVDLANRWLKSPACKKEAKDIGQQAVKHVVDMARQMSEDLKGAEREEVRNVITETEELLCECTKQYDHEKSSVLMDRIKELKKSIQRGVVTRVVEDFIEAEAPLADLDVLADSETDEFKRKFILERKIASLLAQLGRVTKTARFVAGASQHLGVELTQCSEQTELLAPMLVQAAQQRIDNPDNATIVENYKSLLAKYAESISKVRDLCDRAVDPMDFVQTAGDTMQRMREDMTQHNNDPQKCAYASSAITRLANRVIHVSMSSNAVASDPELQKALVAAKQRLHAVTPAPNTRASRLPNWRDTTAEILRTTGDVESALGGENIFKKQPTTANQPIYNGAVELHKSVAEWSSRDNEIVAVARRTAVLMARLSEYMETDRKEALILTSKSIVRESQEVAELAKKLAHECTDVRIKTNLLQTCERIPTISGQLKMLTTVKGSSLGHQGSAEDKEAMDMLVGNAQSLMMSIQEVVKAAASASVKIMSQRGPRLRWVRKNYY